jgi:hypothetical protein
VGGPAVGKVVAGHAGDDRVGKAQLGEDRRHAGWLVGIGRQRFAGGDVAELARARAQAAQDHDGQGLGVPAFAHVGARGALAHRVQSQGVHALAKIEEDLARGQAGANPRRMVRPLFWVGAAGSVCPSTRSLRDRVSTVALTTRI